MVNQLEEQQGLCNLCGKQRAMYAVDASTLEAEDAEKVLERIVGCEVVTLVGSHAGVLTISTTHLTFCANYLTVDLEDIVSGVDSDRKQSSASASFRYELPLIHLVLPRRHLHRDSAVAVFLKPAAVNPRRGSAAPSPPSPASAIPTPSTSSPVASFVALSASTPTVLLNFYRAELPVWQILSIFESASPSLLSPTRTKQKAVTFGQKKSYTPHQTVAASAHEVQKKVYKLLSTLLSMPSPLSTAKWLSGSSITQKWQRREISNFDYLMTLNHIAGRSFQDLSQYPVMPWVLTDFTSRKLDLTNPRVFRDLSLPIGALNPKRWAMLHEVNPLHERHVPFFPSLYATSRSHFLDLICLKHAPCLHLICLFPPALRVVGGGRPDATLSLWFTLLERGARPLLPAPHGALHRARQVHAGRRLRPARPPLPLY
jgi:hypothetical protein